LNTGHETGWLAHGCPAGHPRQESKNSNMEYIAIGFIEKLNDRDLDSLYGEAREYGIELILDEECSINDEVTNGLVIAKENLAIKQIIYLNMPMHGEVEISSNGVSEDLYKYYSDESESITLKFLNNYISRFTQKFYLLCAYSWDNESQLRFLQTNMSKLFDYFKLNNSWFLWYYDLKSRLYKSDIESPLIIEITLDEMR
jgi:hypothetical protein